MVFGHFWLCKTTGWTFGINYGQEITNVVELKYRQQISWNYDRVELVLISVS